MAVEPNKEENRDHSPDGGHHKSEFNKPIQAKFTRDFFFAVNYT
jgi:hypothetical protein